MILILTPALVAAAPQDTAPETAPKSAPVTAPQSQPSQQKHTPQPIEPVRRFVPTEEISPDAEVAFPGNI